MNGSAGSELATHYTIKNNFRESKHVYRIGVISIVRIIAMLKGAQLADLKVVPAAGVERDPEESAERHHARSELDGEDGEDG